MVNTREIAEEYRLSHWAQVMQERAARGMSIREYCKSLGMHENVYYYWQRKLREAAYEATKGEKEAGIGLIPQTPQGWALCETAKPDPEQDTVQIEIGKSRITVHAGTNQELLSNICRMLVSLC